MKAESFPDILVLTGPTAAGKSDIALALAQQLSGEIVSVDATLVYRGLNVGSAKPSQHELRETRHHLIDIREPTEPYSAAEFCTDAKHAVADILGRGRLPVLVGGTMMYLKALLQGMSPMPESDAVIRQEIERRAKQYGWASIHDELKRVDPVSAENIHPNHSQRLSRALEVWRISGKPMSQWQTGFSGGLLDEYTVQQFAFAPRDRALLHQRIATRFDRMLAGGFVDEVKRLLEREGMHAALPAMRAVGYRQISQYLAGDYSYDEMREKALAATRQLAKRQLTWLRKWENIQWIHTQSPLCKSDIEKRNQKYDEIVVECLRNLHKSTI